MLTPEELKNLISEAIKNINPNPVEKEAELMSRKEVAEYFQISLPTLRSWNLRGVISSFKIGGRRYYNKKEVESLINQKYKK